MKQFFPILFFLGFLNCIQVQAQERTITGKVTSLEDDTALPGVNVLVEGSSTGTITNIEGMYSIPVSDDNAVLIFSYVGFQNEEVNVGASDVLNVSLASDLKSLSEVVITALGTKENADELGSTSSKVKGNDIVRSGENQLINGISGRAAGVLVNRSAGDPGAGSYIQIRGQSTITGNSQPLIVVDGIPISNASQDDSPSVEGNTSGGVVQQSRMNDINPNDVESMQILKGASAAALWGSRAANGVIIITTKKGQEGKVNISYKSSYSIDQVNMFHPKQTKFGQGSGGVYNPTDQYSWGDKISERSGGADEVNTTGEYFEGYTGKEYYPIITKNDQKSYDQDNYELLFQDGYTWDNNLSISGGKDGTTFFFSINNLTQEGTFRANSDYKRNSIRFNTEKEFNKVLSIGTNATYIKSTSDRVQRGNNTAGAIVAHLRNPPDFDVSDYIGSYYASPTAAPIENRQRSYRRYLGSTPSPIYNNPLWTLYEQTNSSDVDRIIASADLNIKPVSWFEFTTRLGIDNYTDERLGFFPINEVIGAGSGSFTQQITKETEFTLNTFGKASVPLGQNFFGTFTLGFNINNRKYLNLGTTINNFLITDNPPISFSNAVSTNREPFNFQSTVRTARAFAMANFSAYDAVFLNLSVAGESASTFGENTNSTFYYPAADIAWQFAKPGGIDGFSALSFGKLRASYGVVGVQPEPYRTQNDFVSAQFSNTPWGDSFDGSQFGEGAYIQSKEQGNDQLKPERKTEFEVGADLRFFNDRLKANLTYYGNKVEDLLIPITVAPSIGFASKYANAATMENKGFEVDLGYDIISNNDWLFSVMANFNRNRNEITDLAGTESLFLAGITGFASANAVQGYPVGVLWGGTYARDDDGEIILDANGFPTVDAVSGVIGDPNPDWRGGFGFNASYKGFGLNVLFETSQGGDLYSGTRGVTYNFGTHEDTGNEVTLSRDLVNYAGNTIPAGSTVRGNIYDFGSGPVLLDQSFYTTLGSGFSSLKEQFVYDASWTRLRELTLSYNLNSVGFRETTKLQSVNFAVTGRNLWLMTDVVGIDPETNLTGTSNGRGMDYFNTPGTRSYIFTITINY